MFRRILYSSLSLISSFLVLLLLPWFYRFKCIPGLFAIAWLFVLDIIFGLNPLLIHGDLSDSAGGRVYCDIATKLLIGLQTAIPVTMLCFAFSFEDWLVRPEGPDLQRKHVEHRRRFQLLLCLLAPIVSMALHVAVQDHRFDFVHNVGCVPAVSISVLGWIFVWIVPVIPSCMASIYLVFVMRYRRAPPPIIQEKPPLSDESSDDALFASGPFGITRLVRLGAMMCIVILWTFALAIYALVISAKSRELVFAGRTNLSLIETFDTLNGSTSTTEIQVLLLTGPFFSVLLFAASFDRDVLSSYPHFVKRIFCRSRVSKDDSSSDGDEFLTTMPFKRRTDGRRESEQLLYEVARLMWELENRPITHPEPAFNPYRLRDRWSQHQNREHPVMQQRPRRGSREFDVAMRLYALTRDPRPLSTILERSSIASSEDLRSLISNSTTPSRIRDFLDRVSFPSIGPPLPNGR